MGVGRIIKAATAPFSREKRRKSSSQSNTQNTGVEYTTAETDPEWGPSSSGSRRPLQNTTAGSGHGGNGGGGGTAIPSPRQTSRPPSYGSTLIGSAEGTSKMRGSPERLRRDSLLRVPEDGTMEFEREEGDPGYTTAGVGDEDDADDEDWELEAELALEEQGLYSGSYSRLVALYTLVPLTSILTFTILAFLSAVQSAPSRAYPYAPYLPFPIPELLTTTALWSLTHLLRIPLYSLSFALSLPFPSLSPALPIFLSTALHTIVATFIRLLALPILLIQHHMLFSYPTWHDPAFWRVWWVALGWAAAEGVVGIKQGYEGIALYRDVLVKVQGGGVKSIGKGVDVSGKGGQIYGAMEEGIRMGAREPGSGTGTGPGTERSENNSSANTITTTGGTSSQPVLAPPLHIETQGLHERYVFPIGSSNGERELLLEGRTGTTSGNGNQQFELENALRMQVDRDLDQLMALKGREELEEVYGIPVIRIPVFISCLQRFNSIILSLGLTLLLSSAYIRSSISVSLSNLDGPIIHPPLPPHSHSYLLVEPTSSSPFSTSPFTHVNLPTLPAQRRNYDLPEAALSKPSLTITPTDHTSKSNTPLLITLPVVLAIHLTLATLYTPLVLPRIGVHTAVYVGLLISLGSFFAGLGMWEVLS